MDLENMSEQEIIKVIGSERFGRIKQVISQDRREILDWLQEPSNCLDGRSPYVLFKSGDYQAVDNLLTKTQKLGYL